MLRKFFLISLMVMMGSVLVVGFGIAAEPVKMGIVCELSGSGAPSGLRWERGVLMAVDEINAAGGIMGRKIETFSLDTRTEAPVSVAAMKKAIGRKPFVVMGTVYSSSTIVNMSILQKAGIPQMTGSEAPRITQQGNENIFRSSYHAGLGMQKVIKWITEVLKVKKIAILYANNEFGKGGRDALVKLLEPKGVEIAADIPCEVGQADFAGELARVERSGADAIFIYHHEEENARLLVQIHDLQLDKKMKVLGHVTLMTENVLALAKEAANGVRGHVGLSSEAPPLKPVADRYLAKYGELPDHNFFKGYVATYVVKAVVDETKSFDQQKFRDYLHNRTLCVKDHPGLLMDIYYDENGDIDRESFLVTVQNQAQAITGILDPLNPERFEKCK